LPTVTQRSPVDVQPGFNIFGMYGSNQTAAWRRPFLDSLFNIQRVDSTFNA
jgi:hypothetical protein